MPQLCILFNANYTTLATQRGAMAPWPPLNMLLERTIDKFQIKKQLNLELIQNNLI